MPRKRITLYDAHEKRILEQASAFAEFLTINGTIGDARIPDPVDHFTVVERSRTDFEFEETRLAQAFAELPLMRREVLRLLFVEMRDPAEISEILHCSVNYVHLQKSRALKRLREQLSKPGVGDYE